MLVIQSHRDPLPFPWLQRCIDSVRQWCKSNAFMYRWLADDVFFAALPQDLRQRLADRPVIASDLARLRHLQRALIDHAAVLWLDADTLVFAPDHLRLPNHVMAVGREVWVQADPSGADRLKVYRKVHNALLLFRHGNYFLDFYAETAERLLVENHGPMPPQFIGPKLLTALHNIVHLPICEPAGMLSPPVIKDLAANGGKALRRFQQASEQPIGAANLSASLADNDDTVDRCIDRLLARGQPL